MDFVWETSVIALLAFGLLYWLLSRYAFKPLFGIMEKRRQMVMEQMSQADSNRLEAQKLLEAQQEELQKTRREAYDILEQARQTSSKQADDMIEHAKAETDRLKKDAAREIEREKDKAVADLRSQVGELSVMIAAKIIEKQVDEKVQKEIIDQYLNQSGGPA